MATNSTGRTIRLAAVGLLVLIAAVVTMQNTNVVVFRFLFWQVSISQILLIPLVLLAGFVIGLLAYWLIQKRRGRGSRE